MTLSPSLTFGLLIATLYGALAHLILGGDGRRLLAFVLASWIGFAIGQGIGEVMAIRMFAIGPTNMLTASLGALIAIAAAAVLSAQRRPPLASS